MLKEAFADFVIGSIGLLLIGVGLVILPTPIPFGLAMIVAGLAMVVARSARARGAIRRYRQRNPHLEDGIARFSTRLPTFIRKSVESTNPGSGTIEKR